MTDHASSVRRVVIIGASYGGLAVASELRAAGFEGHVLLISEEHMLPYHRTQLSKECLSGDLTPPAALRPAAFFSDRAIELHTGVRAEEIRRDSRNVRCSNGMVYPYDRLVLAVGARSRRLLNMDGAAEPPLALRDIVDSQALAQRVHSARRIAIVGGGLIGLEVAAVARARGIEVIVLEAARRLMARSVYAPISDRVMEHHLSQGVELRFDTVVSGATAECVTLADGAVIGADVVLAALGNIPRDELAAKAGITCSNGIATNANGQTSDAHIYALGDCALWDFAGAPQRHESVPAAQAQASIVAATILGLPVKETAPLRLWSTQGSLRLQMAGPVLDDADVLLEDVDGGGLIARARRNGDLIAVQAINAPRLFNAALRELGQKEEEYAVV